MPDVLGILNEELRMTAEICIMQLANLATADALPEDDFRVFEILEELDDDTCDLCFELDGQNISRDDPDFDSLANPSHINCRRTLAGIHRDEVGPDGEPIEPDYERPSTELIDKHGHFMVDKEKYAPLRVPSHPEGRDFVARVFVDEEGKRRVRLDWRIPEYVLPH